MISLSISYFLSYIEYFNIQFLKISKVLRLPLSSIYESLNGKVINILADDVDQFDLALEYLHHVWKGPCECVIFGYFIYQYLGVPGMIGLSILFCFMPLQGLQIYQISIYRKYLTVLILAYLSIKASQIQNKLSNQTDIRIRIVSETITGIRIVKMYGLEHVFENKIKEVRRFVLCFIINPISNIFGKHCFTFRKEIGIIQSLYRIRAALVILSLLSRFAIFISLVTFTKLGKETDARNLFQAFAFFNLLNWSMLWQWPFALINCGQGYVALKRIQDFLLAKETYTHVSIETSENEEPLNRTTYPKDETKAVSVKNVTSKWRAGSNRSAGIYCLNLNVGSGELCAIIGPVGSGNYNYFS